jgi:hypothetical protein
MEITPGKLSSIKKKSPVAVYCTKKKKCIALFDSFFLCDKYFNLPNSITSRYAFDHKIYNSKLFNTTIAFRYANENQISLLAENRYMIFDNDFYRDFELKNNDIAKYKEFEKESNIKVGDLVTMKFGLRKGEDFKILEKRLYMKHRLQFLLKSFKDGSEVWVNSHTVELT